MSDAVHVFIATTEGLVAIRGIQHRETSSLASFVTIAGGSRVAAITPDYRNFVTRDTSPLPEYFAYDSYHMVIDKDIHQGQSWQLAGAIAHLLYRHDKLGNGRVEPGDQLIIASGEIDATNAKVSMITHLAQKCLSAQKQIARLQSEHCRISFLIPDENYKQPLPDIGFVLTPLASMNELEQGFVEQGLISQTMGLGARNALSPNTMISMPKRLQSIFYKMLQKKNDKTAAMLVAQGQRSSVHFKQQGVSGLRFFKFGVFGIAGIFLGLMAVIWLISSAVIAWLNDPLIIYTYELKTFDSCELTEAFEQRFNALATTENSVIELTSIKLEQLCTMHISFEYFEAQPQTLWLLTDSFVRLDLKQTISAETGEAVWPIPIPNWQQETRAYTLMIFESQMDASDAQSLDAHLQQTYQQQHANIKVLDHDNQALNTGEVKRPLSIDTLQQWTDKQQVSARLVLQILSTE